MNTMHPSPKAGPMHKARRNAACKCDRDPSNDCSGLEADFPYYSIAYSMDSKKINKAMQHRGTRHIILSLSTGIARVHDPTQVDADQTTDTNNVDDVSHNRLILAQTHVHKHPAVTASSLLGHDMSNCQLHTLQQHLQRLFPRRRPTAPNQHQRCTMGQFSRNVDLMFRMLHHDKRSVGLVRIHVESYHDRGEARLRSPQSA